MFFPLFNEKVSKGLAVLREVVGLVPGHMSARLLIARAFYSTGQEDLAHEALQVRVRTTHANLPKIHLCCQKRK